MTKLTVRIVRVPMSECPCPERRPDAWWVYGFYPGLPNYITPATLKVVVRPTGVSTTDSGLWRQLRHGTAYWLRYREYAGGARHVWSRTDVPLSADDAAKATRNVRVAGLLVWPHAVADLGRGVGLRARAADRFLSMYTDCGNGDGLRYCITDADGRALPGGRGDFFAAEATKACREIAEKLGGREYELVDDASAGLAGLLRQRVARLRPAAVSPYAALATVIASVAAAAATRGS